MQQKNLSLTLQPRAIPDALLTELTSRLPERLQENFRSLVVKPENDQAGSRHQDFAHVTLGRIDENIKPIPQIADNTALIRRIVEGQLDRALENGRIPREQEQAARAEIEKLTAQLQNSRSGSPNVNRNLAERRYQIYLQPAIWAARSPVKEEQIEAPRGEVDKLARDLFELGIIHELRFNWPNALAAYRDAWHLKRDSEQPGESLQRHAADERSGGALLRSGFWSPCGTPTRKCMAT